MDSTGIMLLRADLIPFGKLILCLLIRRYESGSNSSARGYLPVFLTP